MAHCCEALTSGQVLHLGRWSSLESHKAWRHGLIALFYRWESPRVVILWPPGICRVCTLGFPLTSLPPCWRLLQSQDLLTPRGALPGLWLRVLTPGDVALSSHPFPLPSSAFLSEVLGGSVNSSLEVLEALGGETHYKYPAFIISLPGGTVVWVEEADTCRGRKVKTQDSRGASSAGFLGSPCPG